MTSTGPVDWTDDVWRQAFEKFGGATNLTIQLFGPDAQRLTEPLHQNALFSLIRATDDGLVDRCVARFALRRQPPSRGRSLSPPTEISVGGVAIRRDGNICIVAVVGYALTAYLSQLSVRRLSMRPGRSFAELWPVLRKLVPTSCDRLGLYAELLRTLGKKASWRSI
jgi:hypothetical protein